MKEKIIEFLDKRIRQIGMFQNDDIFSLETKLKAFGAQVALEETKEFIETIQDDSK